jgi:hypothetical protein
MEGHFDFRHSRLETNNTKHPTVTTASTTVSLFLPRSIMYRPRPSNKTRNEASKEAFTDIVAAIERDMPVLMHGSGDVRPSAVDPESVRLLSELTANYIADLVHAAVDSHELLNGGAQPLPPPPLCGTQKTATPLPYEDEKKEKDGKGKDTSKSMNNSSKIPEPKYRKRRRVTDEFWDEPLPEPKIKNRATRMNQTKGPKFEGVPVDEWVGVSGVDFFESSRARNAHVSAPSAIGTQSFIFPVCHDVGLYGKVLEVQAARRSIAPLLTDPVIQEVLRNEGAIQGPEALRKRETKGGAARDDEPQETDSEDEEAGAATWPGLESLLPLHTTRDFSQFM